MWVLRRIRLHIDVLSIDDFLFFEILGPTGFRCCGPFSPGILGTGGGM